MSLKDYGDTIFVDGSEGSCCMWSKDPKDCKGCKSLCDMELEDKHGRI